MRDSLHTRARRVRTLATIRAWEYRQRNHSKGVWFRLRRVLANAESAFAIPCSAVEQQEQAGFRRESVGTEIEPHKAILSWRKRGISSKRRGVLVVGLGVVGKLADILQYRIYL